MIARFLKTVALAAMLALPSSAAVRDDAIANIAQKIIAPQTSDFAQKADALATALEAWVKDASDSKKTEAAEAWKSARQSWKRCEAALFGPSQTLHTRARVDFSPANAALLTRTIAGTSVLDEKYIEEQLGASQKGFGALEFLLFPGTIGGEITVTGDATRMRQFAHLLAVNLAHHARRNADAWKEYAPKLATSGQDAVNEIVSQISVQLDTLLNQRFGLWIKAGEGAPNARMNGLRSNQTGADIEAVLVGITSILNGGDGPGLDDAAEAVGAPAAKNLNAALAKVRGAVRAIEGRTGAAHQDAIAAAREECRTALRITRTELVSALGATLFFSDNDGD